MTSAKEAYVRGFEFGRKSATKGLEYAKLYGHRPDWDTYYLMVAQAVAARGDCRRAQHGAVIVQGKRIVGTGYNGTPPGSDLSCLAGDCPRAQLTYAELPPGSSYDTGPGACIATHAEANALLRASWEDMQGATLYVTGEPCGGCAKLIQAAGIERVVTP